MTILFNEALRQRRAARLSAEREDGQTNSLAKASSHWLQEARVPAGSSQGGQWTSNGGTSDQESEQDLLALTNDTTNKPQAKGTSDGNTVTIEFPDGRVTTLTDGNRPWRTNNHGSLMDGPFARRHGAIGREGPIAIFPDKATGDAAQEALIRGSSYNKLSINEAIEKYASGKTDKPGKYKENVRNWGNFTGDEIIKNLNKEEFKRLINAIRRQEGGSVSIGTINTYRKS